jgi:hypothetical protein
VLKQTIKYTDFDGEQQEEDWHFHLTKADVVEMQMEFGGTLDEGALEKRVKELFATKDAKVIIKFFKDMIAKSVGKRDGKRFVRTEEVANDFMQTEAYSAFFMSLVTDAEAGAAFFRSIVPADWAKQMDFTGTTVATPGQDPKSQFNNTGTPATEEDNRPAWIRENRFPTKTELMAMPKEEMAAAMLKRVNSQQPAPGV